MSTVVFIGDSPSKYDFISYCKPLISITPHNETHSLLIGGKHVVVTVINKWNEFGLQCISEAKYVCVFDSKLESWLDTDGKLPSNFIISPSHEKIMSYLDVESNNPKHEYVNWYGCT